MTVIESSAMNVAIEGTYDFDSNIDYTLGFALRDLRAGASDAFGEMEDDGLGNQFFFACLERWKPRNTPTIEKRHGTTGDKPFKRKRPD